jgi:hypothetical protein
MRPFRRFLYTDTSYIVCLSAVRHVSITSSSDAVADFSNPSIIRGGRVYTERDWNPLREKDVRALDPAA